MYCKSIDKMTAKTSNLSSRLESVTFNSIRKVLPDSVIEQACCDADHDYRNRIITPIMTVLHMTLAAWGLMCQ